MHTHATTGRLTFPPFCPPDQPTEADRIRDTALLCLNEWTSCLTHAHMVCTGLWVVSCCLLDRPIFSAGTGISHLYSLCCISLVHHLGNFLLERG